MGVGIIAGSLFFYDYLNRGGVWRQVLGVCNENLSPLYSFVSRLNYVLVTDR